jgi:hypothetical protein
MVHVGRPGQAHPVSFFPQMRGVRSVRPCLSDPTAVFVKCAFLWVLHRRVVRRAGRHFGEAELTAFRLLLLAYLSALKMEVICASGTSRCLRSTRRHIPELLVVTCCENLRSNIMQRIFFVTSFTTLDLNITLANEHQAARSKP